MRNYVLIFIYLLLFLAPELRAEENQFCVELIRHAVYNYYAGKQQTSTYDEAKNNICSEYHQLKSGGRKADSSGNYAYIFNGDVHYDEQQMEEIGSAMCEDNYSLNKFRNSIDVFSRTLDPGAVEIMKSCAEAEQHGVKTEIAYPSTEGNTMVVSMYFQPPSGDLTPHGNLRTKILCPEG